MCERVVEVFQELIFYGINRDKCEHTKHGLLVIGGTGHIFPDEATLEIFCDGFLVPALEEIINIWRVKLENLELSKS